MARQFELGYIHSDLADGWCFDPDLVIQTDDFYDSVSPSENIWKKFELLPTPPRSPSRDVEEDREDVNLSLPTEDWLSKFMCFDQAPGLNSKLIQDCMWSGSDEEQARASRTRKYSLSETTMQTASISSVDPTSVATAVPRQQNEMEHSYSLTTPEPTGVSPFPTPAASDSGESRIRNL